MWCGAPWPTSLHPAMGSLIKKRRTRMRKKKHKKLLKKTRWQRREQGRRTGRAFERGAELAETRLERLGRRFEVVHQLGDQVREAPRRGHRPLRPWPPELVPGAVHIGRRQPKGRDGDDEGEPSGDVDGFE